MVLFNFTLGGFMKYLLDGYGFGKHEGYGLGANV